ncbi:MAG: AAA family ATPase [Deltaproteobacteria bacterium]|nr:AAA family ATPase [Deltaproteobacteria bacterium]
MTATGTSDTPDSPLWLGRDRSQAIYVTRDGVDDRFRRAMAAGKHVVVFGNADTGKSALMRHQLANTPYIVVQCSSQMKVTDVYRLVLSEADIALVVNERRKKSKSLTATVNVATDREADEVAELRVAPQIDLANVRDVLRLIERQTKIRVVVLEDFHYLKWKVQRTLAHDLKAAYESSPLVFVVVGVWSDTDRLSLLSGDLVGRSVLIDAGRWTPVALDSVAQAYERTVGRSLPPPVRERLVLDSMGCVGILSDATQRALSLMTGRDLGGDQCQPFVDEVISDMLGELSVSYRYFIDRFWTRRQSGKSRAAAVVMLHLLHTNIENLRDGIGREAILASGRVAPNLEPFVDEDLIDDVLERIEAFQRKRGVHPPILSYDRRRQLLRIVDNRFLLFLKHAGVDAEMKKLDGTIKAWVAEDEQARLAQLQQEKAEASARRRQNRQAQAAKRRQDADQALVAQAATIVRSAGEGPRVGDDSTPRSRANRKARPKKGAPRR